MVAVPNIFTSPVLYYRGVAARDPSWLFAALPLVFSVGIYTVTGSVASWRSVAALGRNEPLVVVVGALSAATATAVVALLAAVGVVSVDLLLSGPQARLRKVVECVLLANWVLVPWALTNLCFILVWFHPHPASDTEQLAAQMVIMDSDPANSAMNLVGAYVGLWMLSLYACILRVVSGFTTVGALAAWVVFSAVLVALRWVL